MDATEFDSLDLPEAHTTLERAESAKSFLASAGERIVFDFGVSWRTPMSTQGLLWMYSSRTACLNMTFKVARDRLIVAGFRVPSS